MVITAIKLLNKNLKATFLLCVVARVFWIVVKWFYGPSSYVIGYSLDF